MPLQTQELEDVLQGLSTEEIRDQINGWCCRQILETGMHRWANIKPTTAFGHRYFLDGTVMAAEGFTLTRMQLEALDTWFLSPDVSMPKTREVCMAIRLWKCQELLFIREELYRRFNSSKISQIYGAWKAGQLLWQHWWEKIRHMQGLIDSLYREYWNTTSYKKPVY